MGLFAIFATSDNTETMHYTFIDHQGSLSAYTTDSSVTRLSYDAWGRRRNAADGSYDSVPVAEPVEAFDRGYTGHEHLDAFGLINMNGRLYDPMLGRMLSPDIVVQQTDYTQSYNRYSYCFNNPLRFTDPTGWVVDVWEIDDCGNIVNRIEDKTQDAFYLVKKDENGKYERVKDEDGNYKSITFDYGTVERQKTISFVKAGVKGNYDTYEVRGDDNGTQLFEFMASNTSVEWGRFLLGNKGYQGLNVISSSHEEAKEGATRFLLENKYQYGYTIRGHHHSHPHNTRFPSGLTNGGKDIGMAKMMTNVSLKNGRGIPSFKIFIPNTQEYIEYNQNSSIFDFPELVQFYDLPEIQIISDSIK